MTSSYQLSNAVLPGSTSSESIFIENGRISEAIGAAVEIDCRGFVVLPGFVDAHMHLDKTLWGLPWRPHSAGKSLSDKIKNERAVRSEIGADPFTQACALIEHASNLGTTHIRTHVDVDPDLGFSHIDAIVAARDACRHLVDIQIVAFPQSGLLSCPGTADLMREALGRGVDLVGGIDPAVIDGDAKSHIETILTMARDHNVSVDIHHHEEGDDGADTLEMLLDATVNFDMKGRVTLSHAFCIGMVSPERREKLLEKISKADAAVMTHAPGYKPFPPLDELRAHGIRTCSGSDNVRDVWSPYGTADMLERAMFLGYRSNYRCDHEIEYAVHVCTYGGAEVLGMNDYGLSLGCQADLVLVPAETVAHAVVSRSTDRLVFKKGQLVHGAVQAK